MKFIEEFQNQRKEQRSESQEARLVKAITELERKVKGQLLSIKSITDNYNEGVKEKYHTSTKSVGWKLSALGFNKRKRSDGQNIVWDELLITRLKERYGLDFNKINEKQDEIKRHKRHKRHSTNIDGDFNDDVLNDNSGTMPKTLQKRHYENPNKHRANDVNDINDVFSNETQKEIDDFMEET